MSEAARVDAAQPSPCARPRRSTCSRRRAGSATTATTRSTPSTRRSACTTTSPSRPRRALVRHGRADRRRRLLRGPAGRRQHRGPRRHAADRAPRHQPARAHRHQQGHPGRRRHGRRQCRRGRHPGGPRPALGPADQRRRPARDRGRARQRRPFALLGGTAHGTGRGELVEAVADGGTWWWVVVPNADGHVDRRRSTPSLRPLGRAASGPCARGTAAVGASRDAGYPRQALGGRRSTTTCSRRPSSCARPAPRPRRDLRGAGALRDPALRLRPDLPGPGRRPGRTPTTSARRARRRPPRRPGARPGRSPAPTW